MVANNTDTESPLDILLRGSNSASPSPGIMIPGVVLERRIAPAVERAEEVLSQHYFMLWERSPTFAERAYRPGKFSRVTKLPGSVSIGSAGILPEVHPQTPYHVVACTIDPKVAEEAAAENDLAINRSFVDHLGVTDHTLASLVTLAADEAAGGSPNGRLFSEHIAHSIVLRFINLARTDVPAAPGSHALPKRHLIRVLAMMDERYADNLSIADLATETGYSPSHFLRLFRSATGSTPHRFLMEIRLKKAALLLTHGARPITEIAFAAGFSSHAHFTRAFTQHFGVSPSVYRRS